MTSEEWDEQAAARYDAASLEMYAPELIGATVDFLAELAPGGRALEFAVGTGRIALPLLARGLTVTGIDSSAPMAAVLSGKPDGDRIPVAIGDMATTRVPGQFDLVYLVYNGITKLLTQAGQVQCFRNAARHLRPGGHFVIETFVPDLQRLPPGALAQAFRIEPDRVAFDTFDLLNQRLTSHHYTISAGRAEVFHSEHRFVWPSELDLMGELAGLHLEGRWADWTRAKFTAESPSHVSVWHYGDGEMTA